MAEDIIFDNYTAISFKRALGTRQITGSWLAPTWVGDHARRLAAYKILQSYYDNASRWFLQLTDSHDQDRADNHREYGDADTLRLTIMAALIGDDQDVVVDAATDFDPEAEGEPDPDAAAAFALQEWLRGWAWDDERLGLKIIETERNAVGLGDGVYTLGWDPVKGRPRLRVFDPGFYFPVLTDSNEDDFPARVHVAWELEGDKPGDVVVRRITWELVDLPEPRSYPWNDGPTSKTCLMSDGTWTLPAGRSATVDDLTESSVVWETYTDPTTGAEVEWQDVDLRIDFIPVVHVPNTVSLLQHFGTSAVTKVLQIIDDLCNADTDLQAASATTGKPPVAVSGATMNVTPTYKAGSVWSLGEGGSASMIDTSASLDALLNYTAALLDRLSTNARVPSALLGRVKPSEVPSGIALALSFGPLESMIREMRLVRDEKYPILLKFAWRIAVAGQADGVPVTWFPARVEFGRFMPQDQPAMVELVSKLLSTTPPSISLETAVQMLAGVGVPIDSIPEEVARIESRDFKGAADLIEATGSDEATFDYLGLELPEPSPNGGRPLPGGPPVPPLPAESER